MRDQPTDETPEPSNPPIGPMTEVRVSLIDPPSRHVTLRTFPDDDFTTTANSITQTLLSERGYISGLRDAPGDHPGQGEWLAIPVRNIAYITVVGRLIIDDDGNPLGGDLGRSGARRPDVSP